MCLRASSAAAGDVSHEPELGQLEDAVAAVGGVGGEAASRPARASEGALSGPVARSVGCGFSAVGGGSAA